MSSGSYMAQGGRLNGALASLVSIKDLTTLSDREIDILNAVIENQILTNSRITDILKAEVERAMRELSECAK